VTEKVGMIVAMHREITPLLQRVGKYTRETIGARPCYRFPLPGFECLLIDCGIGQKRAKAAALALIDAHHPRLLVSFGVAGGVQDDLQVGDVVLAETAALLVEETLRQHLPLVRVSREALQACSRALQERGAALCEGGTITTAGSQVVRLGAEGFPHPVLDMETHGVAQAAAEKGIPLLGIRALSDSVREPLPFDLAKFTDAQYNLHTSRFIAFILRHPRVLPRLLRLARNTNRAAENAAVAVLAVLAALADEAAGGAAGEPGAALRRRA
jgi:adenosylhomocysteine nucleosidase